MPKAHHPAMTLMIARLGAPRRELTELEPIVEVPES
jgi:hypothetical protein